MRLARFHGFLSIRYKKNGYMSRTNIKNKLGENFSELMEKYFHKYQQDSIKEKLLNNFARVQEIELSHIKFLVMLGIGSPPKKAAHIYHYKKKRMKEDYPSFIEKMNDLILNTDLVSRLDKYIRKNCPDLKEYWMPHLI